MERHPGTVGRRMSVKEEWWAVVLYIQIGLLPQHLPAKSKKPLKEELAISVITLESEKLSNSRL
jgi:hypothetical protein